MGLVRYNLGTMPENRRDPDAHRHDKRFARLQQRQLEASTIRRTEADVAPRFQALQNQIISFDQ